MHVQLLPGAVDTPNPKVIVNGLPGWKLVGQQTPSTTATYDVEDGVKDFAQGIYPGPPGSVRGRKVRLYASPLGVGEIGWICLSHAC